MFPGMVLGPYRPTGLRAMTAEGKAESRNAKRVAVRQATALATLSAAEAAARLDLRWDEPLKHPTFYKAVYRPAMLRTGVLSPELKFHSLRHTYASLCVAAGISPSEIARFMGHAKVTTTLTVYAHLFDDDHADAMTALGAMADGNVVQLRRSVGVWAVTILSTRRISAAASKADDTVSACLPTLVGRCL
jgi:hypothetical protein